jgi:hypothetical protein
VDKVSDNAKGVNKEEEEAVMEEEEKQEKEDKEEKEEITGTGTVQRVLVCTLMRSKGISSEHQLVHCYASLPVYGRYQVCTVLVKDSCNKNWCGCTMFENRCTMLLVIRYVTKRQLITRMWISRRKQTSSRR